MQALSAQKLKVIILREVDQVKSGPLMEACEKSFVFTSTIKVIGLLETTTTAAALPTSIYIVNE